MPRTVYVGIVALALFAGLLGGRYLAPGKTLTQERIVTVDRDTTLTWQAYVGHTEIATATKTNVVWVTRTEKRPDGTVISETRGQQGSETATTTRQDVQSQTVQVREVVKYQDKEVIKRVETARNDWLIAGHVGTRFDALTPVYGGSVHRRILGPITLGAWVQGEHLQQQGLAGGVTLGLTF